MTDLGSRSSVAIDATACALLVFGLRRLFRGEALAYKRVSVVREI